MDVADFTIIHFNGADRTLDRETTDATVVHPISNRCESFLNNYMETNDIKNIGGVYLLKGLGSDVIDSLNREGFIETTFFVDDMLKNYI